jgi:hypothetical protein
MILQPSRRSLIVGMASLLAAPAIVRVSSLMPVKVIDNHDEMMMELYIKHRARFVKEFLNLMQAAEDDLYNTTGLPLELY